MHDQTPLKHEIAKLPNHLKQALSPPFLTVLAALKLHGFLVLRADETLPRISPDTNLWAELSHPSVWIHAQGAPTHQLKHATAGTAEHTQLTNQVITANLTQQQRLLGLLDEFYKQHTPSSFYARLIVETIDLGESMLRPQGASVRIILNSEAMQRHWAKQGTQEFYAFAEFLAHKTPTKE